MSDELKLTLPERKVKISWVRSPLFFLLIAALALAVANIVLVLAVRGTPAALSAGKQQDLAIKLESQGLVAPAIEAWKTYLAQAPLSARKKSSVWYRIGKIQQEANASEEALASYYRSEALSQDPSTRKELDRRVQECLESLGKYAALRQELTRRVSLKEDPALEGILAEVAGEKITQAALERKIDDAIQVQLAPYAPYLAAGELAKRKEDLFQKYSTRDARVQFLNSYLVEQMLYLKALDDKLPDDSNVRNLLQFSDRQVLAQSALTRAMADGIKITATDVSTYYEANKVRYKEGERQKGFDEVKDQVTADLSNAKAKELQDSLIAELKKKYDVVVNAGSVDAAQSK